MQKRSTEEIEASTERLMEDLKTIVHDGEELLRASAKDLSERGAAARERLAAAIAIAKETRQKLQQQARAGLEATDQLVRDHPYQSLGLVFGLGFLIGVLLKRR
jgi:ElaB/YqjD/DUF883 family membrane-anchored ribosome-binding protein